MTGANPEPRKWTDPELQAAALAAITDFVAERQAEGGAAYRAAFDACRAVVTRLFDSTSDLRTLADGRALAADPALIDAARYLDGPPVSRDDLATIVAAAGTAGRPARQVAEVVQAGLDEDRFPWLFTTPPREPSATERDLAIRWTTGLWAVQRTATQRRGEAANRQEEAVKILLRKLEYDEVPRRQIDYVNDLEPGQFCPEALVFGAKCDVPIRLRNGQLLLVECKVSSSSVNSVKRLNHECGNKANRWKTQFGAQAYTMAVLAGVFRLTNLKMAQNTQGIYIVWERDLAALETFVRASG